MHCQEQRIGGLPDIAATLLNGDLTIIISIEAVLEYIFGRGLDVIVFKLPLIIFYDHFKAFLKQNFQC